LKRVLVTGPNGFIGRNALVPLLKRGFEVHAAYIAHPLEIKGVVWHECNLLDASKTRALVSAIRPTHLLHFAWNVEHGKYWSSPSNLEWLAASLQLIQFFQEFGGQRMVGVGTCAEYEWGRGTSRCVEQETPLKPATLYGAAKNALRQVVESFAAANDLEFAWGRIFLPFGPHEHGARLVPSVTRALVRGEIAECSAGTHVRDFLYVEDVADAFAALTDSAAVGAFNIASGEPVTVREVAERLAKIAGRVDLLRLGALPERAGDPPVLVADTTRLRSAVGWKPKSSLDEALASTVNWWRKQAPTEQHASRV
jgi:nucleoside-diphosphate-sugar epimerase